MIGPHVSFLVPVSQAGLVEKLLLAYHVEAVREAAEALPAPETPLKTPLEPR